MPQQGKRGATDAFSSFRAKLIILVAIALGPIFLIISVYSQSSVAQARSSAEARLHSIAAALITIQANLIEDAGNLLGAIAEQPATRSGDPAAVAGILRLLFRTSGIYSNLLVADAEGRVYADAIGTKPFEVGDRAYFHLAMAKRAFTAGGYVISRSTGFPSLIFAQPVLEPDGRVGSLIIASLRLDRYKRFLAGLLNGEGTSFEIYDRDGVRLYAEPECEALAPGGLADPAFFARALQARRGTYAEEAGLAAFGEARGLAAFECLVLEGEEEPSYVVRVTQTEASAIGAARDGARTTMVLLGLSSLASLVLAGLAAQFLLVRRVSALTAAAARFVGGDYGARAGVKPGRDEIGGLLRAFDALAAALAGKIASDEDRAQQLRRALAEKEVLLREVHHRVKNNFQTISSLLSLQAELIRDEEALKHFRESEQRIHSMALIHETLYRSDELSRIDFGEYLGALSRSIQRNYQGKRPIALRLDLEGLELNLDAAIPLGLAFNEVLSNAYKHAFPGPGPAEPEIRVWFGRKGEGPIELRVEDNGRGFPPGFDPERSTTLGTQLICMLASQARGTVEFTASPEGGARITILFVG